MTTNYAFNAESGLPTLVTLYGGRQIEYDYDAEGILTRRILSTNTDVNELFSYDENGLISTHKIGFITESENAETGETEEEFVGDKYTYTYDDNYNITKIKKGEEIQQSYEYDALNQLVKESDSETGKILTYSYDGYGNITSKTEYAYAEDGTLGEPVDIINYTYDSEWKDKLTSYDGEAITYDEIGNPITYRGATMTWFGRQMMSYSKNGTNISYTYDADGLRTSKTVNGVKHNYYYVDGQLRYERNGDSYEIYYTYDADGRPVLATKRDLVAKKNYQYYLITNTRGDVIETRNGDGNVNAKFVYDAWGKLIAVTDVNGNALATDSFAYQISLKYRGYVYDNETGLYYLQSRYYDPEVGRFINADDVDSIDENGYLLEHFVLQHIKNDSVSYLYNNPYAKVSGPNVISGTIYSQEYTGSFRALSASYRLNCSIEGVHVFADYKKGVIQVWNLQSDIDKIFETGKTKTFTYVIRKLVNMIEPEALKGRTYEGIAFELISHYVWLKVNIMKNNTTTTDCGATYGDLGYDKNASIFEKDKSKLKSVESYLTGGNLLFAVITLLPTLIRLGVQKVFG